MILYLSVPEGKRRVLGRNSPSVFTMGTSPVAESGDTRYRKPLFPEDSVVFLERYPLRDTMEISNEIAIELGIDSPDIKSLVVTLAEMRRQLTGHYAGKLCRSAYIALCQTYANCTYDSFCSHKLRVSNPLLGYPGAIPFRVATMRKSATAQVTHEYSQTTAFVLCAQEVQVYSVQYCGRYCRQWGVEVPPQKLEACLEIRS